MLSSLSGKLSVLQTSSANNLARQQFRGFNICTEKLGLNNKGGSKFAGFGGPFGLRGFKFSRGVWILKKEKPSFGFG